MCYPCDGVLFIGLISKGESKLHQSELKHQRLIPEGVPLL